MHADAALNEEVRERLFPNSRLKGSANLFVCPNMDSANIAFNITRAMTDGVVLGPILMGSAKPAHVLTSAATVRRVFNMTALACVEAQIRDQVHAALEAEAARMGD
jgi:malate dehydrogenase (oxaloacetate-decarboxylating)(NADP+)